MRKLILLSVAAVSIVAANPAYAQYRGERHRHHGSGHGVWVAPLIGGMVVGGVLGSIFSEPRHVAPPPVYLGDYPRCRQVVIGYDYNSEPVFRRICD